MNEQRDIERIVHEVLRRLRETDAAAPVNPLDDCQAGFGELRLTTRVITTAEVEGRLEGIQKVVANKGAVLTPSVRDEFRRRKIAVLTEDEPATVGVVDGLRIAAAETAYRPLGLQKWLSEAGFGCQLVAGDGLIEVIQKMGAGIASEKRRGLLLTERTAAALCLANRQQGLRAIKGEDCQSARQEIEEIGANMMIVNPLAHSQYSLRQLTRTFAECGRLECPAEYQSMLGD